ncbi:MAG: 3-hydroxyacyl-CoA dehydrogenase/enoyl-CoA hydratase family protein [Chloroflexi bacterium]|nr:3-hydroxyacyl-CoA dehydrogenase/enoyl-CoA hydratase family protein [Chloroflexota bacterium]
MTRIQKVAVIGAGTMGGGIAALCANAGLQVALLDVAPEQLNDEERARGASLDDRAVRNRIVAAGLARLKAARPAALAVPERAEAITVGNLVDDMALVAAADWIIEVIVERLDAKRALMERIDAVRHPGSIVSSNTSGIPIADIAAGRSDSFRAHFMGTHFFNPPRYLYLLEVIPTADTAPAALAAMVQFADERLGKGVVIARDRPNFIGNRIFNYAGQVTVHYALAHGYSVEEVDALTGELIGNPRTATFRLIDLVGLDVMQHVTQNVYEAAPDDEERELFRVPAPLATMLQRGWLGNKAGVGFYREVRGAAGREFWPLDLTTLEHVAPRKPRFDLVTRARRIDVLRDRLRFIVDRADDDRAAALLAETLLRTVAYAARRVPEIADRLIDVDNAMRWGFNQQLGPFEVWDAIGVAHGAELMRRRGIAVAGWVEAMLAAGVSSFYQREHGRVTGVYDPLTAQVVPYAPPAGMIVLDDLRGAGAELARNPSASILDLGDGVLCLEFHAKVNAIDPLIDEMGRTALRMLADDRWVALVIGNQGSDFSAGVNLAVAAMSVAQGKIDEVRQAGRATQQLFQAIRLSPKPVVAAPHGRVLGGGVEICLAAARRVAAAESYMGLVELGVGLIPGWGGCKEFVRRHVSPHARLAGIDPLPALQRVFETIALAKVSESAEQARALGYLAEDDRIVMNRARLIAEAKREALALVAAGYVAPPADGEPVYAIGRRGIAALRIGIHAMRTGGYISDYDVRLATELATVLCGGDLSVGQWVSEQYLLDLEFAATARLITEPRTQARIMAILQDGKPLRN